MLLFILSKIYCIIENVKLTHFGIFIYFMILSCRAIKTRGNTPKYGLIYHSTFIGRAGKTNKGRISRYLANKCSVATRIDCFRGKINLSGFWLYDFCLKLSPSLFFYNWISFLLYIIMCISYIATYFLSTKEKKILRLLPFYGRYICLLINLIFLY